MTTLYNHQQQEQQITEEWQISASEKVMDDPLLSALSLVSEHFGYCCTIEALVAGLPLSKTNITPDLLPQIATRAGLKAKLVCKDLSQISSIMLPSIMLLKNKDACVLRRIDHENQTLVIQFAENKGMQEFSFSEFNQLYVGYVFLVKQIYLPQETTNSLGAQNKGHWLWEKVKQASPIYRDVIIASIFINLFALISPLFIMNVYDKILPNLALDSLWVLAIGVGIAFLFDFVMRQLRSSMLDSSGKKIDILVSSKIFSKFMGLPLNQHTLSTGSMVKKMSEFDAIRAFLTSATIVTLVDLPFALLFFFVIFIIAGDLALPPFIACLLILASTLIIQSRLKKAIHESQKFAAAKQGHLIESLNALESVKANNAEGKLQAHWQQMVAHTAKWQLKTKKLSNLLTNTSHFILQFCIVSIVILGVYRVANGDISMGGIIAVVMLSSRAISPLSQLAGLMIKANHSVAAIRELDQTMTKADEFEDSGQKINLTNFQGKLEFDNVTFRYQEKSKTLFDRLSLTIKPGEKIAIIGRNGSGKSTLAKLVMGLYTPSDGSVRYDGVNGNQVHPTDLRKNFGYLPQDLVLFNGSIKDNILFGASHISEQQLIRAVKLSGVDQFTLNESEGLLQQVGEGGKALSRGQRQSIALARAILQAPKILIMDEPTASLDARTEKHFVQTISQLTNNKSLILVTHKMHLLSLVDRIILLDKGKILADGPKKEILHKLNQGSQIKEGVNA